MKAFSNLGSRKKIIIGFSTILISLVVILLVSLISIKNIREIQLQLEQSFIITRNLTQLRADQNRMRGLVLELFLRSTADHKNTILGRIDEHDQKMQRQMEMVKRDLTKMPEISKLFYEVEISINTYLNNRANQLDLLNQGKYQETLDYTEDVQGPLYNKIRDTIIAIENALDLKTDQLDQESHTLLSRSQNIILLMGLLLVLVSIGILVGLLRMFAKLSREMHEGVTVLGTSSAEIQTTVAEISTGAAETATAISETTTTVEEIRQTSMLSNQKAKGLLESAQRASEIADKGIESSQMMIDSMNRIDSQMKLINNTIMKLSEQNRSIGEITSTVADIADQSNLLAVNAAIEAAKAGEHGRGFTVVAQEIRSLAEQSKKSTAQVKDILNEIQKSVQQAVEVIKQGSVTVEEGSRLVSDDRLIVDALTETVHQAMQASIQISSSSQQQMVGMDQIVPAMENIKRASEQNVAGIRQAQDATRNLNELGMNLKAVIENYRL